MAWPEDGENDERGTIRCAADFGWQVINDERVNAERQGVGSDF
jgi:hypothetical protein